MLNPPLDTVTGVGNVPKAIPTTSDVDHVGASRLGTGTDRIRANLATFNIQQVVEATRIPSMHLESFIEHGDELSADQLDRVMGFMRGEYALSGTSNTWVRRPMRATGKLGHLPIACTDLPVGEARPHPCGDDAPVATESTGPDPLRLERRFRSQIKRDQPAPEAEFGRRN